MHDVGPRCSKLWAWALLTPPLVLFQRLFELWALQKWSNTRRFDVLALVLACPSTRPFYVDYDKDLFFSFFETALLFLRSSSYLTSSSTLNPTKYDVLAAAVASPVHVAVNVVSQLCIPSFSRVGSLCEGAGEFFSESLKPFWSPPLELLASLNSRGRVRMLLAL